MFWWIIVALFIGAILGFATACLCNISHESNSRSIQKRRNDPHPGKSLWGE